MADVYDELQVAIRDVLTRHGEMAMSDAVVVVATMDQDGESSLITAAGDLSLWSILGHLDYARADVIRSMPPGEQR